MPTMLIILIFLFLPSHSAGSEKPALLPGPPLAEQPAVPAAAMEEWLLGSGRWVAANYRLTEVGGRRRCDLPRCPPRLSDGTRECASYHASLGPYLANLSSLPHTNPELQRAVCATEQIVLPRLRSDPVTGPWTFLSVQGFSVQSPGTVTNQSASLPLLHQAFLTQLTPRKAVTLVLDNSDQRFTTHMTALARALLQTLASHDRLAALLFTSPTLRHSNVDTETESTAAAISRLRDVTDSLTADRSTTDDDVIASFAAAAAGILANSDSCRRRRRFVVLLTDRQFSRETSDRIEKALEGVDVSLLSFSLNPHTDDTHLKTLSCQLSGQWQRVMPDDSPLLQSTRYLALFRQPDFSRVQWAWSSDHEDDSMLRACVAISDGDQTSEDIVGVLCRYTEFRQLQKADRDQVMTRIGEDISCKDELSEEVLESRRMENSKCNSGVSAERLIRAAEDSIADTAFQAESHITIVTLNEECPFESSGNLSTVRHTQSSQLLLSSESESSEKKHLADSLCMSAALEPLWRRTLDSLVGVRGFSYIDTRSRYRRQYPGSIQHPGQDTPGSAALDRRIERLMAEVTSPSKAVAVIGWLGDQSNRALLASLLLAQLDSLTSRDHASLFHPDSINTPIQPVSEMFRSSLELEISRIKGRVSNMGYSMEMLLQHAFDSLRVASPLPRGCPKVVLISTDQPISLISLNLVDSLNRERQVRVFVFSVNQTRVDRVGRQVSCDHHGIFHRVDTPHDLSRVAEYYSALSPAEYSTRVTWSTVDLVRPGGEGGMTGCRSVIEFEDGWPRVHGVACVSLDHALLLRLPDYYRARQQLQSSSGSECPASLLPEPSLSALRTGLSQCPAAPIMRSANQVIAHTEKALRETARHAETRFTLLRQSAECDSSAAAAAGVLHEACVSDVTSYQPLEGYSRPVTLDSGVMTSSGRIRAKLGPAPAVRDLASNEEMSDLVCLALHLDTLWREWRAQSPYLTWQFFSATRPAAAFSRLYPGVRPLAADCPDHSPTANVSAKMFEPLRRIPKTLVFLIHCAHEDNLSQMTELATQFVNIIGYQDRVNFILPDSSPVFLSSVPGSQLPISRLLDTLESFQLKSFSNFSSSVQIALENFKEDEEHEGCSRNLIIMSDDSLTYRDLDLLTSTAQQHAIRVNSYLFGREADQSNFRKLSCDVIGRTSTVTSSSDVEELVLEFGATLGTTSGDVSWTPPHLDTLSGSEVITACVSVSDLESTDRSLGMLCSDLAVQPLEDFPDSQLELARISKKKPECGRKEPGGGGQWREGCEPAALASAVQLSGQIEDHLRRLNSIMLDGTRTGACAGRDSSDLCHTSGISSTMVIDLQSSDNLPYEQYQTAKKMMCACQSLEYEWKAFESFVSGIFWNSPLANQISFSSDDVTTFAQSPPMRDLDCSSNQGLANKLLSDQAKETMRQLSPRFSRVDLMVASTGEGDDHLLRHVAASFVQGLDSHHVASARSLIGWQVAARHATANQKQAIVRLLSQTQPTLNVSASNITTLLHQDWSVLGQSNPDCSSVSIVVTDVNLQPFQTQAIFRTFREGRLGVILNFSPETTASMRIETSCENPNAFKIDFGPITFRRLFDIEQIIAIFKGRRKDRSDHKYVRWKQFSRLGDSQSNDSLAACLPLVEPTSSLLLSTNCVTLSLNKFTQLFHSQMTLRSLLSEGGDWCVSNEETVTRLRSLPGFVPPACQTPAAAGAPPESQFISVQSSGVPLVLVLSMVVTALLVAICVALALIGYCSVVNQPKNLYQLLQSSPLPRPRATRPRASTSCATCPPPPGGPPASPPPPGRSGTAAAASTPSCTSSVSTWTACTWAVAVAAARLTATLP